MLDKITEKIKSYSGTPPVEELRQAAVLIAVTDSEDPELIYTLRSNKVGSHGGEVSFPGGMFEKEDKDLNHRLQRHSIWHEKARIQKRNTTQGVPRYD